MADVDKFRELVLYVAEKCERWRLFNYTKLNKILFYVDFEAYRRWGHSISDQEYQKLEFGPAPRGIVGLVDELQADKEAVVIRRHVRDYVQQRLVAVRSANVDVFTGREVALIDAVLDDCKHDTADAISTKSHQHIGWLAAEMHETIPYSTALVSRRALTPDEIDTVKS